MARRVLVTGATSGIGEATVDRLLDEGADVLATARSAEDLERLAEQGADPIELELRDPDSLAEAAGEVGADRPLDGLVHNAGIGIPGAVEDLGRKAWQRQFDVNLFGPVELTRLLAPALREAEGRIVLVSSLAALTHLPYYAAYCASKAALETVGDTLRLEMGPAGVDVSIIEPGPVATRFQARAGALLGEHVDVEASPHADAYEGVDERFVESMPTVSADDVARAIMKGLTARRPPTRIPVGRRSWMATKVLGWLPDRLQDRMLRWALGSR